MPAGCCARCPRHHLHGDVAQGAGGEHGRGRRDDGTRQRAGTGARIDDGERHRPAELVPPRVERPGEDGAEEGADLR
jgi:hypothetical protein